MPKLMEASTARTEDKTEAAPFMPQSQAVSSRERSAAIFMPVGNAVPATSPSGANRQTATKMRVMLSADI